MQHDDKSAGPAPLTRYTMTRWLNEQDYLSFGSQWVYLAVDVDKEFNKLQRLVNQNATAAVIRDEELAVAIRRIRQHGKNGHFVGCPSQEAWINDGQSEPLGTCDCNTTPSEAAGGAQAVPDWQLIATAPKDQPLVGFAESLIHLDFNPRGRVEMYWQDGEGWIAAVWDDEHDTWYPKVVEPTHWMLPEVPTGSTIVVPLPDARVWALARAGAIENHNYLIEKWRGQSGLLLATGHHNGPFSTCSHPDCARFRTHTCIFCSGTGKHREDGDTCGNCHGTGQVRASSSPAGTELTK